MHYPEMRSINVCNPNEKSMTMKLKEKKAIKEA
jgi:hypothetical protein